MFHSHLPTGNQFARYSLSIRSASIALAKLASANTGQPSRSQSTASLKAKSRCIVNSSIRHSTLLMGTKRAQPRFQDCALCQPIRLNEHRVFRPFAKFPVCQVPVCFAPAKCVVVFVARGRD